MVQIHKISAAGGIRHQIHEKGPSVNKCRRLVYKEYNEWYDVRMRPKGITKGKEDKRYKDDIRRMLRMKHWILAMAEPMQMISHIIN